MTISSLSQAEEREPFMDRYQRRLAGLLKQLAVGAAEGLPESPSDLASWYMSQGFALGLDREDLLSRLAPHPEIAGEASALPQSAIQGDKPQSELSIGDPVQVILNERNRTPHRGEVVLITWHHERERWFYHVEDNGKFIHKRYWAEDLEPHKGNSDST